MLNKTSLTEEQLASLATALEKADDQRGLARAFIGQRSIGIHSFNLMRDTTDLTAPPVGQSRPLNQRLLINVTVFLSSPQYLYDSCGFLQWDELNYLQLMDRYIQTAQTDFPERIAAAHALPSLSSASAFPIIINYPSPSRNSRHSATAGYRPILSMASRCATRNSRQGMP